MFSVTSWIISMVACTSKRCLWHVLGKIHLKFTWPEHGPWTQHQGLCSAVCTHTIHSSWKNKGMPRMCPHFASSGPYAVRTCRWPPNSRLVCGLAFARPQWAISALRNKNIIECFNYIAVLKVEERSFLFKMRQIQSWLVWFFALMSPWKWAPSRKLICPVWSTTEWW